MTGANGQLRFRCPQVLGKSCKVHGEGRNISVRKIKNRKKTGYIDICLLLSLSNSPNLQDTIGFVSRISLLFIFTNIKKSQYRVNYPSHIISDKLLIIA